MFNPLIEDYVKYSDEELHNKILDVTRKYFQTSHPVIKQQMSQILNLYKEEEAKRLAQQTQSTENFDDLISVN